MYSDPTIRRRHGALLIAAVISLLPACTRPAEEPPTTAPTPSNAPQVGPAGNGLVAFSNDGDIFVGDPVTGAYRAIINGPTHDTRPMFSPDGLHIAFLRGIAYSGDSNIVVVDVDGSDERVAVPIDVGLFAWNPDGGSILVQHGAFGRQLTLYDISGIAEPRLLTPPLPESIGALYFSLNLEVAPILRPPNGDQILASFGWAEPPSTLTVLGEDGTVVSEFPPPLAYFEQRYRFDFPAWSPDGSMVLYSVQPGSDSTEPFRLYVTNADGSEPRLLAAVPPDLPASGYPLYHRQWAPDGSAVAYEKAVLESGEAGAVIAIVDVTSGAEIVFQNSYAALKPSANAATDPEACRTITFRCAHDWANEGWLWTPDGRGILVLEEHGMRPMVIDIESGVTTELPWASESTPSWQRVALASG